MLEVHGLSIAFGSKCVVDDVSLSLVAGETLALVGESGSGKSLTALSILRLLPVIATATGRITLDGQNVLPPVRAPCRRSAAAPPASCFKSR